LLVTGLVLLWKFTIQPPPQVTENASRTAPITIQAADSEATGVNHRLQPQPPSSVEAEPDPQDSSAVAEQLTPTESPKPETHEAVTQTELKTPSTREYFAFRDTIKINTAEAAESFLIEHPDSTLSEIIKVHVLQQTERIDILQEQADSGDTEAQLVMSELSSTGWGLEKDQAQAIAYAETAAQLDQPFPNYHLASLLLAETSSESLLDERIAQLLEKSADAGFFLAQTLLGNLLFTGRIEVAEAKQKGLIRYQQAAAQGDRNALFNLGLIYDSGLGDIPQDQQLAEGYFKQAAALGHQQAANYIP
jgi:hypothetical protein